MAQAVVVATESMTRSGSMVLMKNMLRLSLSTICHERSLFDESQFKKINYGDVDIYQLEADVVNEKTGKTNAEVQMLLRWLNEGIYAALDHEYLESIIFAIYTEHPITKEDLLLERYEFSLGYIDHNADGNGTLLPTINNIPLISKEGARTQAKKLMKSLKELCDTFDDLPEKKFLSVMLKYNKNTPEDYQPPCFMHTDATRSNFIKDLPIQNRVNVGSLDPNHVQLSLNFQGLESFDVRELSKIGIDGGVEDPPTLPSPRDDRVSVTSTTTKSSSATRSSGFSLKGIRDFSVKSNKYEGKTYLAAAKLKKESKNEKREEAGKEAAWLSKKDYQQVAREEVARTKKQEQERIASSKREQEEREAAILIEKQQERERIASTRKQREEANLAKKKQEEVAREEAKLLKKKREEQEAREAQEAQEAREAQEAQEAREAQEAQEAQEAREAQEKAESLKKQKEAREDQERDEIFEEMLLEEQEEKIKPKAVLKGPRPTRIVQIDPKTNNKLHIFLSAADAAKAVGLSVGSINDGVKRRVSRGGYRWERQSDELLQSTNEREAQVAGEAREKAESLKKKKIQEQAEQEEREDREEYERREEQEAVEAQDEEMLLEEQQVAREERARGQEVRDEHEAQEASLKKQQAEMERLAEQEEKIKPKAVLKGPRPTRIVQIDPKTNNKLRSFSSAADAAKAVGLSVGSINDGVKRNVLRGGYRWERESDELLQPTEGCANIEDLLTRSQEPVGRVQSNYVIPMMSILEEIQQLTGTENAVDYGREAATRSPSAYQSNGEEYLVDASASTVQESVATASDQPKLDEGYYHMQIDEVDIGSILLDYEKEPSVVEVSPPAVTSTLKRRVITENKSKTKRTKSGVSKEKSGSIDVALNYESEKEVYSAAKELMLRHNRMMETNEVFDAIVSSAPVKLTRRTLSNLHSNVTKAMVTLESEEFLPGADDAANINGGVVDEILIGNLNFGDVEEGFPRSGSTYLNIAVHHEPVVADASSSSNKENLVVVASAIGEQLSAPSVARRIVKAKPKQSQLSEPIFLRKGVNDKEASSHDVIKQLLYT